MKASVLHIVEKFVYKQNGQEFRPTEKEKLLWEFSDELPTGITKKWVNITKEIDVIEGKTKKEITQKYEHNLNINRYDFVDVFISFIRGDGRLELYFHPKKSKTMKVIEIWTRPNSSDVLTRQHKESDKPSFYNWKSHTSVSDCEITRGRFDQLVKEKGFKLLNTIVL